MICIHESYSCRDSVNKHGHQFEDWGGGFHLAERMPSAKRVFTHSPSIPHGPVEHDVGCQRDTYLHFPVWGFEGLTVPARALSLQKNLCRSSRRPDVSDSEIVQMMSFDAYQRLFTWRGSVRGRAVERPIEDTQ